MKPVKHLKVKKGMKISELVSEMGDIGFGARKISQASEILKSMIKDKECKVFFGIAGAMVPGGMKECRRLFRFRVILSLLKKL